MAELFSPTPDDVIAEIEREIRMREQVYAKQVAARRMSQTMMDRRIELLREAIRLIDALAGPRFSPQ